ncbi:MAG TPA: hypothetical protein VGP26_01720 [Actinophytocola sp.]|jgi:hypothetical protein|nr:hypothetical protein [Actinophytocola sp.]
MNADVWVNGPVGLDANLRVTRTGCRLVLVMTPTLTAATRLMDLVPLLECDLRVQVAFTVPRYGETWAGAEEFVRARGGLFVPWNQAVRYEWDLVLAASHRHLEEIRGKVLLLPHGAGAMKSRLYSRKAGSPVRATTDLDREMLTYRGRVVPSVIALTHDRELSVLRRACPEAVGAARVVGDICLDRMAASLPFRHAYRQALGVGEHGTLITVSSTWTPASTFGQLPRIYSQLLAEVGTAHDRTRVAAVLHPNVWAVHGAWQVRAWLADAIRQGLLVVPPDDGWQAAMIASDHVIGDHGSTTSYAAAIGIPATLATFPADNIRAGSIAASLSRAAARLDLDAPLLPQLAVARTRRCAGLARTISSRPGETARLLRLAMYDLLGLPEPSWPPVLPPVPAPAITHGK